MNQQIHLHPGRETTGRLRSRKVRRCDCTTRAAERGREREATEVRPAEFVVDSDNDDEVEEPEELRQVTVGRAPTEGQRREHEVENHSVYREWCVVSCDAWHGSATPTSTKETSRLIKSKKRTQNLPILLLVEHKGGTSLHSCSVILEIRSNCSEQHFRATE